MTIPNKNYIFSTFFCQNWCFLPKSTVFVCVFAKKIVTLHRYEKFTDSNPQHFVAQSYRLAADRYSRKSRFEPELSVRPSVFHFPRISLVAVPDIYVYARQFQPLVLQYVRRADVCAGLGA
jgi:hypothetical protein